MTNSKLSTTPVMPDFMVEASRQWTAELMHEDPQFFINAAMYVGNSNPDRIPSERVLLLEEALKLKDIRALGEWKAEMEMYPTEPLGKDDLSRTSNHDMPFRAFYLIEAVVKLLEITDAPESMRKDLRLFMQSRMPRTAKKRGKIQKALIDHPAWSDTKIATTYKYDLTRMRAEIENGQLRRCPVIDDRPDEA